MMTWERLKVSTLEEVLELINTTTPHPVGIIVFGADCELKSKVLEQLQAGLNHAKVFRGAPTAHQIVELLRSCGAGIVILSSMESANHRTRHECVTMMKKLGATAVIGIYADARPQLTQGQMTAPDFQLMNDTIKRLQENRPTAEGLDDLFIAAEKEG